VSVTYVFLLFVLLSVTYYGGTVHRIGCFLRDFLDTTNLRFSFWRTWYFRSKVQCNTFERDVTWSADPSRCDGFRWRCRRSVARVKESFGFFFFYSLTLLIMLAYWSSLGNVFHLLRLHTPIPFFQHTPRPSIPATLTASANAKLPYLR